jgi:hypothetical protein
MSITVDGREHVLHSGDRVDIGPGQLHAARVGPDGVHYIAGSARQASSRTA